MPRINLLPWREQERKVRRREFMVAAGAAVFAAVLFTLGGKLLYSSWTDSQNEKNNLLKKEIVKLDAQIADIQDLETRKQRLVARMEIIEKLQRKRPEIVHLFDEIVKTVPEGIYLTQIKQTGNKLEIHGVQGLRDGRLEFHAHQRRGRRGSRKRRRNHGQEGCCEMNFVDQLRSLDPRDVGRWPLPVRGFFIALIFAVVAAFAWYMFVWNDDRPLLQKAQADELDLRSQFENKQQRAANLEAYRAQLSEMERSFGAMLRQLPGKTEVPNLLVDISQTGLAAGLQEKLFQPGSEKGNGFYAELPIHIKLVGSYHDFGSFVSGIAALPRIVTLHDIQITPVDAKSYDNLTMDVTAKTYRYIEDEGGAHPAKKKAGGAT